MRSCALSAQMPSDPCLGPIPWVALVELPKHLPKPSLARLNSVGDKEPRERAKSGGSVVSAPSHVTPELLVELRHVFESQVVGRTQLFRPTGKAFGPSLVGPVWARRRKT